MSRKNVHSLKNVCNTFVFSVLLRHSAAPWLQRKQIFPSLLPVRTGMPDATRSPFLKREGIPPSECKMAIGVQNRPSRKLFSAQKSLISTKISPKNGSEACRNASLLRCQREKTRSLSAAAGTIGSQIPRWFCPDGFALFCPRHSFNSAALSRLGWALQPLEGVVRSGRAVPVAGQRRFG